MLWTICLILLVLWALGFFGGFGLALGGGIHLIWVIIIVLVVFALYNRRGGPPL